MEEKNRFAQYRNRIRALSKPRAPLAADAYFRKYGSYQGSPVADDFTLDEILTIIRSGSLQQLRQLSRYYYRINSNYRNNIDFLAHLPLYDSVVIPLFEQDKGSKTQIIKAFYNACSFVDNMDLPNTLARITTQWLITGIYNGIIRFSQDKVTIQDLPLEYCRTRFKDFNNLNILEFNLTYFDRIYDEQYKEEAVATFPKIVQQAWKKWIKGKRKNDPWVMIPASEGGISFSFVNDQTPLLVGSIPQLKKLDDAVKREEKRDENQLYKLLIERMPIDSKGQLVFQLDEVADIHASVADMLKDMDTIDVLTTFGDTDLESLQDSSAASQATDRIEKYKKNAWDALGRAQILFNATNSSSLAYQIKKDESLMIGYLNVYETWIKFLINDHFSRRGLNFDFEIIPTTVFNRQDLQQTYFRGAQYGYSKMFAGVVMGIKQRDQLSLMNFENDFLQMSTKMIPLQSSYTTSGNVIAEEEQSTTQTSTTTKQTVADVDNKGGRPELADELKSEKTQTNRENLG